MYFTTKIRTFFFSFFFSHLKKYIFVTRKEAHAHHFQQLNESCYASILMEENHTHRSFSVLTETYHWNKVPPWIQEDTYIDIPWWRIQTGKLRYFGSGNSYHKRSEEGKKFNSDRKIDEFIEQTNQKLKDRMNETFDRRQSFMQGKKLMESISNSPSSHDSKNRHQLSTHCHISDAWRYLVHRCELVNFSLDLFLS